jgi:hypothetical protein
VRVFRETVGRLGSAELERAYLDTPARAHVLARLEHWLQPEETRS